MKFQELVLKGAYLLNSDTVLDNRGKFIRTFCSKEFGEQGLNSAVSQCNLSFNKHRGTLRGMHYQLRPYEETKVVFCVHGSMYDVIIDLRPNSPTYCQWTAAELHAGDGKMLYIPCGFAHGFQTLEDDTTVSYIMGEAYHPEAAAGVRWNDPAFNIAWPEGLQAVISDKDSGYPDFKR